MCEQAEEEASEAGELKGGLQAEQAGSPEEERSRRAITTRMKEPHEFLFRHPVVAIAPAVFRFAYMYNNFFIENN